MIDLQHRNKSIVECDYVDEPLILASEKAKDYFLKYLEKTYADGMGVEGWYAYMRAMSKED